MQMKQLNMNGKLVKTADRVVEFDAADLPAPGAGFEAFFASLNKEQRPISQQAFDAEVLRTYGRKP